MIYKKENRWKIMITIALISMMALFPVICQAGSPFDVGIDGTAIAKDGFDMTLKTIRVIMTVVGAMLIIIGIVKIVIAQSEDGPHAQPRNIMMLAIGVALILVSVVIKTNEFESMVTFGIISRSKYTVQNFFLTTRHLFQ